MSPQPSGAQSWEVSSRSDRCAGSGDSFEDGQAVMSRLILSEAGVAREDYAIPAWNDELRDEAFVYWKTAFKKPAPKKEEPFKEENAEEAFRELLEQNDDEDRTTLFVLAVMLERKRLFVEQGSQRDPQGHLMRIYEHKDSNESFLVFDPEIPLEDIADVQMEVALKLGWIQPEPEEEEESSDAEGDDAGSDSADSDTNDEVEEESGDTEVEGSTEEDISDEEPEEDSDEDEFEDDEEDEFDEDEFDDDEDEDEE